MIANVEIGETGPVTERLYALDYDMCVYSDSGNYDYNNIRQQVDSESVGMYVVCYKDDKTHSTGKRLRIWLIRVFLLPTPRNDMIFTLSCGA